MTITRVVTATLIFAGVAVGSAAPALAAPPCNQWGFDDLTVFDQSNGWHLGFRATGPTVHGDATATGDEGGSMNGTINGGIEGYAVKLDVNWVEGALGKYEGSVDANGFASGVTYDARNPSSTATWRSQYALRCVTPS